MEKIKGWAKVDGAAVYWVPGDPTKHVVVFEGSPAVSVDGSTQDESYALLLEMGGMGDQEITQYGIASDFLADWPKSGKEIKL